MARGLEGDVVPDVDVPEVQSLAKLRAFLERNEALHDRKRAGAELQLSPRHIDYFTSAACTLGLAERRGADLRLTPRGRRVVETEKGSNEEAASLRRSILESPELAAVAADLFDNPNLTREVLSTRIQGVGYGAPTADKRAGYLLGWRSQLSQANLVLSPSKSRPTYSGRKVLRSLTIESFKAFGARLRDERAQSTHIDLAPLTIFAGPNGAGKSTVLQAITLVCSLVSGTISEVLKSFGWDYSDLPHLRSKKQTITITLDVEIGDRVLTWSVTLGTRLHTGIAAESVRMRHADTDGPVTTLLERQGRSTSILNETKGQLESLRPLTVPQSWLATLDAKKDAADFAGLLALKTWAEGVHAFWALSPEVLRSPSRNPSQHVGPHGEELASFLFHLKRKSATAFDAFVKRVRRHYPRLVTVEPRNSSYGWKSLEITEKWNGEKATFNARQVSDGLLRLLVLASVPDWPMKPSVILVDEIENGLHPRLLGGVASLLAELSQETQVFATTHSPITLNYVDASCVRLVTRGGHGTVKVTPLTATKGFDKLREYFEPGELWYNAGEEQLIPRGKR